MTLIRLIQRASILAGMTVAGLSIPSNPVRAEIKEFCIIASNGKTVCGKSRGIERMCVTTDGSNTICGKFKSAREGENQGQEARQPIQGTVARKEVDNVVYVLKGCRKSDTNIKCELTLTNKGSERSIQLRAYQSTFVDSAGKSHKGSTGDLGGQPSQEPTATITPGIDYSASITFENVPDQAVKAQLLNLEFYHGVNSAYLNVHPVQFKNVSFSN
jgi:hypothetical protein